MIWLLLLATGLIGFAIGAAIACCFEAFDEWYAVECDCDSPAPDGIGECSCCRRRVMPDRR